MSTDHSESDDTRGSIGSPDHGRSGENVDEAVDKAERGSQVEGVHTPSGQAESGDSRLEHLPEVEGIAEQLPVDPAG